MPKATADGYYWQFGLLAPGQEQAIALVTDRSAPSPVGMVNEACLSASNGSDACANAAASAPSPVSPSSRTAAASPSVAASAIPASSTVLRAPAGGELGVWVWTPVNQMSAAEMEQTVNEAAVNHFNVIYLTVDAYLTVADDTPTDASDTAARVAQLQAYNQAVGQFLSLAAAKNISVDAEAGSQDWGEPQNQWEPQRIMAYVASYNQSHALKFRGVQYDIEPYLLPAYGNTTSTELPILTNYVQLVAVLAGQAKSDGLPLTMVVPHFYDDVIQWTPPVTVDGVTGYPYNQLVRILNPVPGARIIVMAYRNFAAGANGSIGLAQREVDVADDSSVRVIVAQETGPVQPGYVTFYGESKSDLAAQADLIEQAFAHDASFQGIAVDYLDPFLALP